MPDIHLDEGYHLDESSQAYIEGEVELEFYNWHEIIRLFSDKAIEVEAELELSWTSSLNLDLLKLIPLKFHNSEILQGYVDEVELEVGSWLTYVRDIVRLQNPNSVASRNYLKYLAQYIGLSLPPEDESTEDEIRRDIIQAVDWYKVKGTYESIAIIALVKKLTINIYDMYTNDYSSFYMVDWFVGDEDENPSGFDSSYYKSPHFGIEIVLNKTYAAGSGESGASSGVGSYLWESDYADNLIKRVEDTRPVHTVPHYILLLNPKTDEFGNIIEVVGDIRTKILADWEVSTKYFDMVESDEAWNFDDGTYFDQSSETFINSITTWVFGTGTVDLSESSPSLENPAISGTIDTDNITIDDEKITFEFIVPKTTKQNGLSELGLYVTATDTLVLASTFPKIDKTDDVELRVLVEIYKKDLSA